MMWIQKKILLPEYARGCHLVTQMVLRDLPELKQIRIGMLHLFLQHTSASLAINENADPDVRLDMETALNRVVPEQQRFIHTVEGPDDMPAHIKSALVGVALSIPISNGLLAFGTWQGIYLCEHRNRGGQRSLIATLQGCS
jgi:secondary thiamine-phosphate synthase enzyme